MASRNSRFVFASFVALAPLTVQAAFEPPTHWTRGSAGSTYQEWDTFIHSNNPIIYAFMSGGTFPNPDTNYADWNAPDVGNVNPNGTAGLREIGGTAMITSTGFDLYSPYNPVAAELTIPTDVDDAADKVTALVQIKMTAPVVADSVKMNGLNWVDSGSLVGAERWFLFNLPYSSFVGSDLSLTFAAPGPHITLDRVAVDTFRADRYVAVPEPACLALLSGGAGLALRRRRK